MIRRRFIFTGTVQGVGFRPTVYRIARSCGLTGSVSNDSSGVTVELQGNTSNLHAFLEELLHSPPPAAHIKSHAEMDVPIVPGELDFCILASNEGESDQPVSVSPDLMICSDCRRELLDPENRRYRYPFVNCTHCGPRFTIVRAIPYDRYRTTMASFTMCAQCRREYEDPEDRRFHAQPVACEVCGPALNLLDQDGKSLQEIQEGNTGAILQFVVRALNDGKLLALKGLGGYQLVCDARSEGSVIRLKNWKERSRKPLAVMFADESMLRHYTLSTNREKDLMISSAGPIVIVESRSDHRLASSVSGHHIRVGAMLPTTPLHELLCRKAGIPLVVTSANHSSEPLHYKDETAIGALAGGVDLMLIHNRPIQMRVDDSVAQIVNGEARVIRRGRGYAPSPLYVQQEAPLPILAVGGDKKGAFALYRGNEILVSHYLGDLDHPRSLDAMVDAIQHYCRILHFYPALLAVDLHPAYRGSEEVKRLYHDTPVLSIQHHHAHAVSCVAHNDFQGRVLALTMDGTGYGDDATLWGGEFLIADELSYARVATLHPMALPGGEKAIHEIWRQGLAGAYAVGLENLEETLDTLLREPRRAEGFSFLELLQILRTGRTEFFPVSSSCGRLFDMVASLAGVRQQITYEGEAAVDLEIALGRDMSLLTQEESYRWVSYQKEGLTYLDWRSLVVEVVEDRLAGKDLELISRRFHSSLIHTFSSLALKICKEQNVEAVALTGGSFQNRFLSMHMERVLKEGGVRTLHHTNIPTNDGGLAVGQAIIAARKWEEKAQCV